MYQMFQNPILEPSSGVNDLNVLYVVDVGILRWLEIVTESKLKISEPNISTVYYPLMKNLLCWVKTFGIYVSEVSQTLISYPHLVTIGFRILPHTYYAGQHYI